MNAVLILNKNSSFSFFSFCLFILCALNLHAQFKDKSGFYLPETNNNSLQINNLVIEYLSPETIVLSTVYSSHKQSKDTLLKIDSTKRFISKYENDNVYQSDKSKLILVIKHLSDMALLFFPKQSQPTIFNLHYDNQYADPFAGKRNKVDERTLETTMLGDSLLCFHLEIETHGGSGSLNGIAIKTDANEFTYYEYPSNDVSLRKEHPDIKDYSCIVSFIKEPSAISVKESHCDVWHGTPVVFDGYYKKVLHQ